MAKLADAPALGAGGRKAVKVRVLSRPQEIMGSQNGAFSFWENKLEEQWVKEGLANASALLMDGSITRSGIGAHLCAGNATSDRTTCGLSRGGPNREVFFILSLILLTIII